MTIIKKFEEITKIKFNDKSLITKLLTHKSFSKIENNEKLEFLGDRVLGLVLSKKLLELYPNETEGSLDKRFAILVNRKILKKFFSKAKPFNWKFLAIDVQLVLFCKSHNLYNNFEEKITYKNLHQNNLGTTYLNIFKKKFWSRRYMQHKYYHFINKNKNINLDYLVTTIIYFFIKFL